MPKINENQKNEYKDVWVIAEVDNNKLHSSTFELLGEARVLADKKNQQVWCVLLGDNVKQYTEEITKYKADNIIIIEDINLKNFNDEFWASSIVKLIDKYKPDIILTAATSKGRALIPRIAVLTETGLTADCTELDIDPDTGLLLQTRPAFGGNLIATIKTENFRPQMATVRPHVFQKQEPDENYSSKIINESPNNQDFKYKQILEVFAKDKGSKPNFDVHYVITGGRGVRGIEGFQLLKDLANLLSGAVGATRAAVDLGWIPYEHQIGQTGLTVNSKVYIACGVSGQIQHLVGMQNSECIIAINKDENAPIMKVADIAVVGDLFDVVPRFISLIKEEHGIED